MNEQEIIEEFERNLSDFFAVAQDQRTEIENSFLYMDCHRPDKVSTSTGEYGLFNQSNVPAQNRKTQVSLLPAIVRGVAGSEVMQDRHIDIVPIDGQDYDAESDIMDDSVSYAQYASNWKAAYDMAKRDTAICGLGATVSYLDMTRKEAMSGVPSSKRVYPGFLFYDTAARGQDLSSNAEFCGYVDPMRTEDLEEYVREKIGDKDVPDASLTYLSQFLEGKISTSMNVDLLYHYFFRKNIKVMDTESLLYTDEDFKALMAQDDVALELMARWAEEVKVDIDAPYWTLTEEEYKGLQETVEVIQRLTEQEYEIKSSSRKVKCYYRAEFGLGKLLSWSKSYSQNEYPLNIITGYYDESMGIFYGFTRPLSFVQDALDLILDDLVDYADEAAHGGASYVKGSGDDLKAFKRSQAEKERVTPIARDMEIEPKQLASTPEVLLSTAQLLIELLPRSIGVGQEFLGVITSGDMTDSLFGKIVRQSFAVLEDFSNNSAGYSRRQGQLFIDMMLSVAKVEDGRILPVLSPGHQEKDYFRLTQQNIARQYVIRVVERPVTDDERMENMKVLMQLAPNFQQTGINILPSIIKNMRMDQQDRQELLELATPKPQPPDPMSIESIKANIRLLNAQAAKLEGDAMKTGATLEREDEALQAEIDKNVSAAVKNLADANATDREPFLRILDSIKEGRAYQ